ncbi:MAG: lipopolysaccharide heptosyltransferase I [Thiotrichaceae bacterium]|nr:lipopolysaccharide heptosyltransferase I [Thiotrichaceae bacterium]
MRKILIVKTSSLGDIVHMLPAVVDAMRQCDDVQFDWLVEEGFAEVPRWSPLINQVIPVAMRRWKKALFSRQTWAEIKRLKKQLRLQNYDCVIDSQGLVKSAVAARWAKAEQGIWGYDAKSIREPLASRFYQRTFKVNKNQHAITRNRHLMAQALGYTLEGLVLDYGLSTVVFPDLALEITSPYIVALHGTSRVDKEWRESYWGVLLTTLHTNKITVLFPWGNEREHQRAIRLADKHSNVLVLPKASLSHLAGLIAGAEAVIGMDTGLMHIAAALDKSGLGLYPVTRPFLTGVMTGGEVNKIENIAGLDCENVDLVISQLLKGIR